MAQKRRNSQKLERLPRIHINRRDGRLQVDGMDAWYTYWRDPYHLLLTIPWVGFVMVVVAVYVAINAIFALLYLAGGDGIANAEPGSFRDAFFFSVQTLASIGYGAMYPTTLYANIIVTMEAITSLLSIAVLTGLAFARFSRSTARIVFSQNAVITTFQGVPTLMVRLANQRRNYIREGEVQIYLLRDEVDSDGHFMRRFHDLKLIRSRTPSFVLSWTLMHPIDADSPLYHCTPESLRDSHAELLVLIHGVDDTIAQPVHASHTYSTDYILLDYRFADILHVSPEGDRYIDYTDFHTVVPSRFADIPSAHRASNER
ncbi:ion channel [Vacuolonema iberomarrocanum]|uniref:ion channel n=1 Tax=Vacuolonema iberomarrocanum TaxID=3454632 RepID=UPI0019F2DF69|nr:ATP-sensitive inward rectifier potassium channel 10 [filamentous cyanobacterium LEGE 07170]